MNINFTVTETPDSSAYCVVLERDLMRLAAALRAEWGQTTDATDDAETVITYVISHLREIVTSYEQGAAHRAAMLTAPNPADDLDLWPQWRPGIDVEIGQVYLYEATAYEVIQAHTTQAGWAPPQVPALWRGYRDPDDEPGTPPWRSQIWVDAGEVFAYQGTRYEVVQPHVTQTDWRPPDTPALWAPVDELSQ